MASSTTAVLSTSGTTTTPLLLLLDGLLAQDVEPIKMSLAVFRTTLRTATRNNADMMTSSMAEMPLSPLWSIISPFLLLTPHQEDVLAATDSINIPMAEDDDNNNNGVMATQLLHSIPLSVSWIRQLLYMFPQWAQTSNTRDGSLPLHLAASLGNVDVASVLLHHYPQAASTANAKGKIPLHYAARENKVALVEFFLQQSPRTAAIASKKDKLALHFSSGEGNAQVVRLLLQAYPKGASLPSAKGKVPLHFAARWGHLDIAKELLHRFPDCIRAIDWEGSLPLHDAARQGQFPMAGLLVEQFPVALCVQNLRGEVPLFPAARSGNIDLVAYLVQAWPEGSKLVLKSISHDDRIDTWSWDILELLLRGAIHHLDEDDCPVLQGRESPTLRLVGGDVIVNATAASAAASQDLSTRETSKNGKMKNKQKKDVQNDEISGTIEDRQARLVDTTAHGVVVIATTNSSTATAPKTTSKRPNHDELNPRKRPLSSSVHYSPSSGKRILRETLSRSSSTDSDETVSDAIWRCDSGGHSDRIRSCHTPIVLWESPQVEEQVQQDDDLDHKLKPSRAPRAFFHLHAALQSGASIYVVAHVLQMRPRDVFQMDENHCYPLHWAVAWANTADRVNLVLDKIFRPFPRAAQQRTWFENQLPLHIAIKASMRTTNTVTKSLTAEADYGVAAAASECIIKALLQEQPASAVDTCQTRDEWHDQKPLHMASRHDCSVGTLYELLRIDPSLLPSSNSRRSSPPKQTRTRGKKETRSAITS